MSIRFIYGRSGTGKSKFCIDDIKKKLLLDKNKKLVLIVPEQYTFITENYVLREIGEKAFLNVEVLSFKKMANIVFEDCGGRIKKIVSESGKKMLIHKVLNENISSLTYFKRVAKEQGFNEIISEVISEFKKYNVDIDKLKGINQEIDNIELSLKIRELTIIFEAFNNKINEGYIDGEDELNLLSKKLQDCKLYDGSEIWIDEFTTFTPQQLDIIKLLSEKCERINITLTMQSLENIKSKEFTDVFIPIYNTENKILKLMKENNISYDQPINLNKEEYPYRFFNSPQLAHIEKHFFSYPFKEYTGSNNDRVFLYKANNIYDEIDKVARNIVNLVRMEKYRFKDISVVCRNIGDYEKIISVIFNDYNIPYFLDKKIQLVSNPLIIVITSAFEIYLKNWSYESVFKYLKSGLTGIKNECIDLLENFVLQYGIKGDKWNKEYILENPYFIEMMDTNKNIITISEIIEELRKPLLNFHNKIKGKNKVKDICTAIYEFLVELEVFEKIDKWIKNFENNMQEDKVKEYSQVERIVINTLDQAVNVLGNENLDAYEFFKILDSGFNNEEIGIIPVALDQVNIGDVARIKGRDVKTLYIVGINDGILPAVKKDEGILSDKDREILNEYGIELSSSTRKKIFEEQFLAYTALTISSEYLMLSYPMADFEGKSLRPSIIISKIKKIFPNLQEESFINDLSTQKDKLSKIVSPIPTLNDLILTLRRDFEKEEIEDYWAEVYKWFSNNIQYKEKMDTIFRGLEYSNIGDKVSKNKLKELYRNDHGKLMFNVSRLEQYAGCPFSYFVMYGLKAKNRKVYEFTPPDLGSFVHEILDVFTKKVKQSGLLWSELNNNKCKEIVNDIIDKRLESESNSILNSSKRFKYLAKRFKRVISKSVSIISQQISKGEFEVFKTEFEFGNYNSRESVTLDLDSNEKIYLKGRIDRIDKLDLDGNTYIRIIDYKTGSKKFDLNDVYYGLQIQLLVYLDSLIKNSKYILEKQAKPGAILYFRVDDPIIKSKKELTTEEIETEVLDALKLKGLVLKDARVVKAMDKDIDGYSLVIPASFKKDGDFKSNSDVITEEEFDLLREYVNKKMKDLCKEMLSGDIKLEPSKDSNKTYCEYCDFSSICQFDTDIKDNKYKVIIKRNKDVVLNNIKNEIQK